MSHPSTVMRDERTVSVENASYRWAYLVLSFGVLGAIAYRAFVRKETSWDLFGLVIMGGVVVSVYQLTHRVINRRWVIANVGAMVVAAVVAALIAALRWVAR